MKREGCVWLGIMVWLFLSPVARAVDHRMFTRQELEKMGERVYQVRGVNTCISCHGVQGKGGTPVTDAARLDHPRDWKIYRHLGGDKALSREGEEFHKRLESAYVGLVREGAMEWMKRNATQHLQLNPLMYGITQADTLKEIRKIKNELATTKGMNLTPEESKELAAYALVQYLKTLDLGPPRGGVFK